MIASEVADLAEVLERELGLTHSAALSQAQRIIDRLHREHGAYIAYLDRAPL